MTKQKQKGKFCVDCGDEIPKPRVKANPKVERCVECQEDFEKAGNFQRHKMQYAIKTKGDEIDSMEEEIVKGTK